MKGRTGHTYRAFVAVSALASFALGLFGPFWIVFVQDFSGGFQEFGFSVGIMVLVESLTSLWVGERSDRLGRKPFFIASLLVMAAIVLAYTFIDSIVQLYVLQAFDGAAIAVLNTVQASLLGDLTTRSTRGKHVGIFQAVVGVAAAIAIAGGGLVAAAHGFEIIFYGTAVLLVVTALLTHVLIESR